MSFAPFRTRLWRPLALFARKTKKNKNMEDTILKRILSIALALLVLLAGALALAGCGQSAAPAGTESGAGAGSGTGSEAGAGAGTVTESESEGGAGIEAGAGAETGSAGGLSIVATIFPPYDFARSVAGDMAEIAMLLPPGAESHSFEPTPQDIIRIQNCDVFIYNGGESDAWVNEILESMDTAAMNIVKFIDCVETVEEEIVEGMEDDEDEHEHGHGGGEIDPADIQDRPMGDFAGDWLSMIPLISDGSLDEYIGHMAEEAGAAFDDYKALALQMAASDYDNVRIAENTLAIGEASAKYEYMGYELAESDSGQAVWYKYQIAAPAEGMPQRLMFNDHQIASGGEKEEIAHIHMKYGDEGFDALLAAEGAPFYFDSGFSHGEIGAFMAGDHEHEGGEEDGHEHEHEIDEHVWTSPRNAKLIVRRISDALCGTDPANAVAYKRNADEYIDRLDELDAEFRAVVGAAARKTIVFGDRFPFRYFADAYGLDYFAAFPGCSTETEPSAATVAFLIDKINAEKIPAVFHIELSNEKMANTISESTGASVLLLHACHNVSKADFDAGKTYLGLMTENVGALRQALQ
jgi:zinc transport system substrate-binding protein